MTEQNEFQEVAISRQAFLETEVFGTSQLSEDGREMTTNAVFSREHEFPTVEAAQQQVDSLNVQEEEQNRMISEVDENQEIHQSNSHLHVTVMGNVDNCERRAGQLRRMLITLGTYFRGKLHTDSWVMPSRSQTENSHSQVGNGHPLHILRAALTGLTFAQETCNALLADIRKFRKNAWRQGELILDLKDELDQMGSVLGEQQRINKELKKNWDVPNENIEEQSLQQLIAFARRLQDENKSLAAQLDQLQSSNEVGEQGQAQHAVEDRDPDMILVSNIVLESDDENYTDEENALEENITDAEDDMSENHADEEAFEGEGYIAEEDDWDEAYTASETALRILNITKEE